MKIDRLASIDLTPAARRLGRLRAVRVRRWAGLLGLYAAALAGTYFLLAGGHETRQAALAQDARETARQLEQAREDFQALRQELVRAQALLASARVLREQPDWTVLMAALARTMGPDIVLESCSLAPACSADGGAPPGRKAAEARQSESDSPAGGFVLSLTGHARQQTSVWAYALRLERTGLFAQVQTLSTADESFMNGRAVRFKMECRLDGKGPSQ